MLAFSAHKEEPKWHTTSFNDLEGTMFQFNRLFAWSRQSHNYSIHRCRLDCCLIGLGLFFRIRHQFGTPLANWIRSPLLAYCFLLMSILLYIGLSMMSNVAVPRMNRDWSIRFLPFSYRIVEFLKERYNSGVRQRIFRSIRILIYRTAITVSRANRISQVRMKPNCSFDAWNTRPPYKRNDKTSGIGLNTSCQMDWQGLKSHHFLFLSWKAASKTGINSVHYIDNLFGRSFHYHCRYRNNFPGVFWRW